jgi:hypothetical protein
VSPTLSPVNGNRFSFRNVVFFRILDDGRSPQSPAISNVIYHRHGPLECPWKIHFMTHAPRCHQWFDAGHPCIGKSTVITFHSFIHQWLYSALLVPGLFFSFVIIFTKSVGLLGRVISRSQGRYLHTGQHKHGINAHTDIQTFEWDSNPLSQRSSELRQFMP